MTAQIFKLVFWAFFAILLICLMSFIGMQMFGLKVEAETLDRLWEGFVFSFGFLSGGIYSLFTPKLGS